MVARCADPGSPSTIRLPASRAKDRRYMNEPRRRGAAAAAAKGQMAVRCHFVPPQQARWSNTGHKAQRHGNSDSLLQHGWHWWCTGWCDSTIVRQYDMYVAEADCRRRQVDGRRPDPNLIFLQTAEHRTMASNRRASYSSIRVRAGKRDKL